MAGGHARRRGKCALATLILLLCFSPRAHAIEAFDGRIQAHGFLEAQVRGLDAEFQEEFDLAQWYNVINIELEADILPDGWGPFDLLQAYARIEGRYDAVYLGSQTHGTILPSVRTWGNESRRLPLRLRNARDDSYAGSIDTNAQSVPPGMPLRIPPIGPDARNPTGLVLYETISVPQTYEIDPATNQPYPDPRNPVDRTDLVNNLCRDVPATAGCGGPGAVGPDGFPDALQTVKSYNPQTGAFAGYVQLANCSVAGSCYTLPASIGRLAQQVGCATNQPGTSACPVPNLVQLPVGSSRSSLSGRAQKDDYYTLLDRGTESVVDPLTGISGTVPELYGRIAVEQGSGTNPTIGPNPNQAWRVDGAQRTTGGMLLAASENLCPTSVPQRANLRGAMPTSGCYDNRPTVQKVERRLAFPGLSSFFELVGADAVRGDNPDYGNPNPPIGSAVTIDTGTGPRPLTDPEAVQVQQLVREFQSLTVKNDDPAVYLSEAISDVKFTFTNVDRSPAGAGTRIMGPWLPKNTFESLAVLTDRANPFRGRFTPTNILRYSFIPVGGAPRVSGVRYHELDVTGGVVDPTTLTYPIDPLDQRLKDLEALTADTKAMGLILGARNLNPYPANDFFHNLFSNQLFGGDFNGIAPCRPPNRQVDRANFGRAGDQSTPDTQQLVGTRFDRGCIPWTNTRVEGGFGEAPMRVAPDISNLAAFTDERVAQGIYIPSAGLIRYLENGDFDPHEFNISQIDRSFNRGASQQDTYEVKEAYLDMEFLDSRLWIRAGIQNIVWGKTELFRTTDQFNPVDFALASLPSLEESRIALLSARAVYSFYDVGPLADVRLELAANFDRFKPNDLGACGEPYTLDVVCGVTTGLFFHGVAGLGIAGVDRPPAAWNDVDGIEYGGRIEFRWDRFSFALADFYGYEDIPYPDPIMFFSRNVDPLTGRMRKAFSEGRCENAGGFNGIRYAANGSQTAGQRRYHYGNRLLGVPPADYTTAVQDDYVKQFATSSVLGVGIDEACLKPGGAGGFPNENRFETTKGGIGYVDADGNSRDPSNYALYLGDLATQGFIDATITSSTSVTDDATRGQWNLDCQAIKNAAESDPTVVVPVQCIGVPGVSVDNALTNHPANQQLFATVCLGTITVANAISPSACALNVLGSGDDLSQGVITYPLSEALTAVLAGESDVLVQNFLGIIQRNTKAGNTFALTPLATMNRGQRDGRVTGQSGFLRRVASDQNLLATADPPIFQPEFQDGNGDGQGDSVGRESSLDSTLTSEQRALLGCGPFFGTRCDTGRVNIDLAGNVLFGPFGGVDLLNAEGSYLVHAWPGVEGTGPEFFEPFSDPRLVDSVDTNGDGVPDSNFPGVGDDGRINAWVTWSTQAQPGTIGFPNDTYCTRFATDADLQRLRDAVQANTAAGQPFVADSYARALAKAEETQLVKLPGCRGADAVTVNRADQTVDVVFEAGYDPLVDGCMFGPTMKDRSRGPGNIVTYNVRAVDSGGNPDALMQLRLAQTCFNGNATTYRVARNQGTQDPVDTDPTQKWQSGTAQLQLYKAPTFAQLSGSRTLWHPVAGCSGALPFVGYDNGTLLPNGVVEEVFQGSQPNGLCQFANRDWATDFLNQGQTVTVPGVGDRFVPEGAAQIFRTEMSALSWNFLQFLVLNSCNAVSGGDDLADADCFDPNQSWAMNRCSLSQPQYCRSVKGMLGTGVGRNDVRAGGNPAFGRRDFAWQSGGEVVLKYAQRNVFGFSMDFAEDVTKTNWGLEFTWIGATPFIDANSMNFISDHQTFNLTVSVDRPTFINFLNANRTFFMNTQWFFRYIDDYQKGIYAQQHPFNVLFTFAVFTGYYQDRFQPQLVTVYDFFSQSAGILPQVAYRFTDSLSITFGVSFFFGRAERVVMPLQGIAPNGARAGPHTYEDSTERLLSNFRFRDEAWMRLRWTF